VGAQAPGATAAATATFSPPVFSAVVGAQAPGATAAATATFSPPVFTATVGAQAPGETAAAAATFSPPVFTAVVGAQAPGETAAATATFSPPVFTATVAAQAPGVTASATATFTPAAFTATVAAQAPGETAAATATFSPPVFTAVVGAQAPGVTAAATATFSPPVFTAVVAAQAPGETAAAAATFSPPVFTATVAAQAPGVTAAAAATFSPPVFTAVVGAQAPGVTVSATATFSPPVFTAAVAAQAPGETAAATATFSMLSVANVVAVAPGVQAAIMATVDNPPVPTGTGMFQTTAFYQRGNAALSLGPFASPPAPAVVAPLTGEAMTRDPNLSRWRDIVLDPCNRTAQNRNTAAIRDALEAIVDNLPEEQQPTETGGDALIFFQVNEDAVGEAFTAVTEMIYNGTTGEWEPTGAAYTAYDWTPSQAWRTNFRGGFFGVGRINTNVAADALEVLALEGLARFIEVTLNENMGATTNKQAEATVQVYWGDATNGRDPGTTVIIHDVTNMAPQRLQDENALAIWDDKRGAYVMIAPWDGLQAPGQAAIVKVLGGDASKGCNDNVKPDQFCVHTGKVQNISLAGEFCTEKFTDGAPVWILDARSCHTNNRLNMHERYVAVSMGLTWDPDPNGPDTDERYLYVVVDYAPALRWFKILNDASTLAFTIPETNELKCRSHDCGGPQPDDAPSTWAKWVDIDPCTRQETTLDNTPTLIYFPMHRARCKAVEEQTEAEKCKNEDANPKCRHDKFVLAFWNPIAERWDAMADVGDCAQDEEVALIIVCDGEADPDCCVFDALKISVYPRGDSYCDPVKERTPVWVRCTNGQLALTDGYCELGVKICNAFTCKNERRPMYMFQCGQCDVCRCPDYGSPIRFTLRVANPAGPCGYLDGISGEALCLDSNPFINNPPPGAGWYAVFDVEGVEPRLVYLTFPNDTAHYPDGAWLEIECAPEGGQILSAWCENNGVLEACTHGIPTPNDYDTAIVDCRHLEFWDTASSTWVRQYRARSYKYGMWITCVPGGQGISGLVIYLLSAATSFVSVNPLCDDKGFRAVISSVNAVLTDGEGVPIPNNACCDNFMRIPMQKDMGCRSEAPDIPIIGLNSGPGGGTNTCKECANQGAGLHMFGGCPCNWIVSSGGNCTVGQANCGASPFPTETSQGCCEHEENQVFFDFEWPFVVEPA
jgi:hypothetical protein